MTTTDAPTSPREFVLVDGDGREVHRYTQKGAANRRAKTIPGARVLTADETPAEAAAAAEEDAEFMDYVADAPEQTLTDLDVVAAFLATMADRAEEDFPQSEEVTIHWPVRDVDEMTGTDWPELGRRVKDTERAARYAAESAVGPAVEIMRDGEWVETRRYINPGFAARAARGLATRQKRAQEHARVVAPDGTVLLDTDTDELTIQARIDGVVLTGVRPL